MDITVIIPAFNAHDTIKDAIDSIYETKLPYQNIEVIISDDNSIKPYDYLKENYPDIKIICSNKNRGAGIARQLAIPESTMEYITFLDADDKIRLDGLMYDMIDDYDVISSNVNYVEYGTNKLINKFHAKCDNLTHGRFYKKEFLMKYNIRFDPFLRLYEDSYFNECAVRYAEAKKSIYYTDAVCYTHYDYPLSTTKKIDNFLVSTKDIGIKSQCLVLERCRDILNYDFIKEISYLFYCVNYYDLDASVKQKSYYTIFDFIKRNLGIENIYDMQEYFGEDIVLYKDIIDYYNEWLGTFNKIHLSIIIPLYNSHMYITDTLNLLYKTLGDYIQYTEIILEDDNSDIPDYAYLFDDTKNIKIHHNYKNLKMGLNRERGLKSAKGKYVTFLDHDDELTQDMINDIFNNDYDDNVNIIRGMNLNCGNINYTSTPYYCIELLHGVYYRRKFLLDNNIHFNENIQTSEDSFFNRKSLLISKYLYGENSIVDVKKEYYRWNLHNDSTFMKLYNEREYSEEFFRDYAKAVIDAYNDIRLPECVRIMGYVWIIYIAEDHLFTWERNSKNYNLYNIKVLCSVLLNMERDLGVTKDTFLDFISININDILDYYYNEPIVTNNKGLIYVSKCYEMLDEYDGKDKDYLLDILS